MWPDFFDHGASTPVYGPGLAAAIVIWYVLLAVWPRLTDLVLESARIAVLYITTAS